MQIVTMSVCGFLVGASAGLSSDSTIPKSGDPLDRPWCSYGMSWPWTRPSPSGSTWQRKGGMGDCIETWFFNMVKSLVVFKLVFTLFEKTISPTVGGGSKYFLIFKPLPGEMVQCDEYFHLGWNHQREDFAFDQSVWDQLNVRSEQFIRMSCCEHAGCCTTQVYKESILLWIQNP